MNLQYLRIAKKSNYIIAEEILRNVFRLYINIAPNFIRYD